MSTEFNTIHDTGVKDAVMQITEFSGGDKGQISYGGSGRLVGCLKCPECGYSVA